VGVHSKEDDMDWKLEVVDGNSWAIQEVKHHSR
jgi:hypothetical protein